MLRAQPRWWGPRYFLEHPPCRSHMPTIRWLRSRPRSTATAPGRAAALTYNDKLERGAQTAVHPGDPSGGEVYGYNSRVKLIVGWGDPQAAAINDAYHKGAGGLISNCDFTEFGVGFYRDESLEWDSVSIYFGAPSAAPPASTPVVTPAPAGKQCPVGSPTPTVGIHETCAAPTNQVSVSFVKGLMWTVNATNASNIAGKCVHRRRSGQQATGLSTSPRTVRRVFKSLRLCRSPRTPS